MYGSTAATAVQSQTGGLGTLVFTAPYTGRLRLASSSPIYAAPFFSTPIDSIRAAESATETLLDTHRNAYPTGGSVTLGVQDAASSPTGRSRAILRLTLTVGYLDGSQSGNMLLFVLPHHRTKMVYPDLNGPNSPLVSLAWSDPRGEVRGMAVAPANGAVNLDLAYDMPDVRFEAGRAVPESYRQAIISQLLSTDQNVALAPAGTSVNRVAAVLQDMARTAVIADELAVTAPPYGTQLRAAATKLRQTMKNELSAWLLPSASAPKGLAYDITWGGIISLGPARQGARDMDDKNNAYWNHVYHYGPLLYAAAAVARDGGMGWSEAERAALLAVVRDVANPNPSDPWFPVVRHMDWWAGHSWASGLVNGGVDRDFGRWVTYRAQLIVDRRACIVYNPRVTGEWYTCELPGLRVG